MLYYLYNVLQNTNEKPRSTENTKKHDLGNAQGSTEEMAGKQGSGYRSLRNYLSIYLID